MVRPLSIAFAGFALAIVAAGPAGATVYKWTDSQGRIVYSDQPPPTSVKGEQLQAAPPPANPNAAKELAQQEADYRKHVADEATARASAAKARTAEADRTRACAMAKANLLQLADRSTPLAGYGADGTRATMSDSARAEEQERLTAFMREHKCPG